MVLSPSLFCIYFDELLRRLRETDVGCHVGHMMCAAFGYADYYLALAYMLLICGLKQLSLLLVNMAWLSMLRKQIAYVLVKMHVHYTVKKIRYFNVNLPYFLRFLSVACHLRSFNRIFLNKRQFTVDALRQGKCASAVPRTPPYCSDTVWITGTSSSSIMFRILRI